MKKTEKTRLMQRSLLAMLVLLLALPGMAGALSFEEAIQGADGNLLSTVSTYAGTGEYSDVNGKATEASFRSPEGVLVLADGTVLVADTTNDRIRKIDGNEVTTFAGLSFISVDPSDRVTGALLDGTNETAAFYAPKGLAADLQGNVYVADSDNHAIRKISSDGQVTTVAGDGILGMQDGKESQARFYNPSDVVVDENGVLYVADTLNHVIRKIDPNGVVTTLNAASDRIVEVSPGDLVETGDYKDGALQQAKFNEPSSIVIDEKGNLIVADSGNHLIRYIDLTNETVTTLAGNTDIQYAEQSLYALAGYQDGTAQDALFNFPKGIAITDEGGLVIADSMNHRIRYLYDDQVITIAGGDSAGNADGVNGVNRLEIPTDVAIRSDGSILIADTYNHQLRLFTLYQLPSGLTNERINIVYGTDVIDMDTNPEIVNDRTMVPVRAVSEHLGYTVTYEFDEDEDMQSVLLEKEDVTLRLTIGDPQLQVLELERERSITMDTVPYIAGDRTYVPLRFFSEAFGYDVEWHGDTRTVIIR